jgi:hypothetical protein
VLAKQLDRDAASVLAKRPDRQEASPGLVTAARKGGGEASPGLVTAARQTRADSGESAHESIAVRGNVKTEGNNWVTCALGGWLA